jgi:hypothetical protein
MNPKSVFLVHDEMDESNPCYSGVLSNPRMIEFVGRRQVRGFPIESLNQYILQANPESDGDTSTPPDELTLEYLTAVVTLEGWRLDLLTVELRFGHVVRVRVVPPPAKESKVGEPHVTRIWVRDFNTPTDEESGMPVAQPAAN